MIWTRLFSPLIPSCLLCLPSNWKVVVRAVISDVKKQREADGIKFNLSTDDEIKKQAQQYLTGTLKRKIAKAKGQGGVQLLQQHTLSQKRHQRSRRVNSVARTEAAAAAAAAAAAGNNVLLL